MPTKLTLEIYKFLDGGGTLVTELKGIDWISKNMRQGSPAEIQIMHVMDQHSFRFRDAWANGTIYSMSIFSRTGTAERLDKIVVTRLAGAYITQVQHHTDYENGNILESVMITAEKFKMELQSMTSTGEWTGF